MIIAQFVKKEKKLDQEYHHIFKNLKLELMETLIWVEHYDDVELIWV